MNAVKKPLTLRIACTLGMLAVLLGATESRAVIFPIPSPGFCTVPRMIRIVSLDANGTPDPAGFIRVVVRDIHNGPIANAQVVLQFRDCGAVRIASTGYPPGVIVDCRPTQRTVRRFANAQGEADFVIPGGGLPGATNPPSCLDVFAEGVLLKSIPVSTADLDSFQGVGANDLSLWLTAFDAGDLSLADLDADGIVGANDLSEWLEVFVTGLDVATPSLCP